MWVLSLLFTLFLIFAFLFVGRILMTILWYHIAKWKLDPQIKHFKTWIPLRLFFSSNYQKFLKGAQDENGEPIPVLFAGPFFDGNISLFISGKNHIRSN